MENKQEPKINVWSKIEGYHQEIMAKLDEMLVLIRLIRKEREEFWREYLNNTQNGRILIVN